tara:strand:+ start:11203 stop:11835 length:633 start_codon:yes stop_codon:yes gene_type:complete
MKIVLTALLLNPFIFAGGSILRFDHQLTASLQGNNSNAVMDYSIETIALSTPFIEYGWAFSLWHGNDFQKRTAEMTTSAMLWSEITALLLKYAIKRDRPKRNKYTPRLWNTRITPSFPSGHVTASAAFSTVMGTRYPNLAVPLTAYTLISAYSQIYVGNHYVSDVVGGIVLGYITGRLVVNKMTPSQNDSDSPQQIVILTIGIPLESKNK